MNISFKSVEIEGFQSIGSARVELASQGIVIVKGVNNYEDNASSNGSGKSSIFESILWALYGRTSFGITDPTNRYTDKGCYVKLDFNVDNKDYTVIRSIKSDTYKTGLILLKDGSDISGRNKTDTEKMIKNDILRVDLDIFLSTIFLSQGFSGRISTLSPSGRKERIETLTDTASLVDEFSTKMSNLKTVYSLSVDELNRDKSYNEGIKTNLSRQIESIISDIKKFEEDKNSIPLETLEDELHDTESLLGKTESEIADVDSQIRNIESIRSNVSVREASIENEERKINDHLSKLGTAKICPECGQLMNDSKHEELKKKYESRKIEIDNEKKLLEEKNTSLEGKYIDLNNRKTILSNDRRDSFSAIMSLKESIGKIKAQNSTLSSRDKLKDMKSELFDVGVKISDLEKKISDKSMLLDVAKNCQGLISKQFRGYLLQEIVNFMNSRLKRYSTYLFSEDSDKISLVVDASKLDIYLGDVLYDTLSGGEKKKVDLALVLTQRDLALNIAGFSCNLLILDEVLENLDNTATTCSLNLLMEASSDIESMFIISHNNYAIQSDSVITIEKDSSRISHVKIDVI